MASLLDNNNNTSIARKGSMGSSWVPYARAWVHGGQIPCTYQDSSAVDRAGCKSGLI